MAFAGLNYVAVLVAAVAGFAVGAAWYSVLGARWMEAARLTKDDLARDGFAAKLPFVLAALCHLVMAFMLAGMMGHVGRVDVTGGLISAFFVWFGFVLTTMTVSHRFQNARWFLTVIDGGHWLGALLVQGAVIGAFGV